MYKWPATIVCALLLSVLPFKALHAGSAADKSLIAVFPKNFPPIYSVTENGVPSGFGIEFAEQVAKEAGLHIEYRSKATWSDAIEALKTGEADLVPNMGITKWRGPVMDFSQPIHETRVSIFVNYANNEIHTFEDLQDKLVGVVRSNVGASLLRKHPSIYTRRYPSLNELFVALLEEEVDAVVYPAPNFVNLALRLGTDDHIKSVGQPLTIVQRAMAVRKGNTALLEKLNPAITSVLQSRRYQRLLQRWFPPPPPFWTTERVAFFLAGLLIVVAVIWQVYRIVILRKLNGQLLAANNFSNAVLDAALEGVVSVDFRGHITSINAAGERMFGRPKADVIDTPVNWLLAGPDAHELLTSLEKFQSLPAHNRQWSSQRLWECAGRRNDGELFPVQISVSPMNMNGEPSFVFILHDESRVRQAEMRAEHLLNHDPLTGLLNQRGVCAALDVFISQRASLPFACLCIGLQRLTNINVTYGRQVGDTVLVQSAANLDQIFDDCNKRLEAIARVGGERFLLVVPATDSDSAITLAERVMELFQQYPVKIDDGKKSIEVDAQVGIACYPKHGTTSEELVYRAEVAFYEGRERKATRVYVYDSTETSKQSKVEHALQRVKSALNEDRVLLHFQPIKHIASGRVLHHEVLLRMYDDDGTIIKPSDIIPVAERFGLITRIDYRVMQLALTYMASMQDTSDITLSVNLSPIHLGDTKLFSWLNEVFLENPLLAQNIIFEITETAALQNMTSAKQFMDDLKNLGCRFALDDFGVGFTSFAQLRNLPVDVIKIDGMFVRYLSHSAEDQVLVQAMTDVVHSLGKKVVAEYVEDEATYTLLREYGVDFAQGYYIGRPVPDLDIDNDTSSHISNHTDTHNKQGKDIKAQHS
ncbi:MAG: EAL domain-containing protein [Gammaproteobacteria bacterium]